MTIAGASSEAMTGRAEGVGAVKYVHADAKAVKADAEKPGDEDKDDDEEESNVSLAAMEIALNAVRIHGGYGYSTEFDVERYFRDAPLMIVGEGTNEIQRNVIAGQLVARGGI